MCDLSHAYSVKKDTYHLSSCAHGPFCPPPPPPPALALSLFCSLCPRLAARCNCAIFAWLTDGPLSLSLSLSLPPSLPPSCCPSLMNLPHRFGEFLPPPNERDSRLTTDTAPHILTTGGACARHHAMWKEHAYQIGWLHIGSVCSAALSHDHVGLHVNIWGRALARH